jgi:hypothetical protein
LTRFRVKFYSIIEIKKINFLLYLNQIPPPINDTVINTNNRIFCKKCGGGDHQKASSKKCKFYRVVTNNSGTNVNIELTTNVNNESTSEKRHDIGVMTTKCNKCEAIFWVEERLSSSSKSNPRFSICCKNGKIILNQLSQPPEPLRSFLLENNSVSKLFRSNFRAYNSAFAFASLGAHVDEAVTGKGIYNFRIQGSVYHRIGSVVPEDKSTPKFAQIYIYDTENELKNRLKIFNNQLNESIMIKLQQMIHNVNPFVQNFKFAFNFLTNNTCKDVTLVLRTDT